METPLLPDELDDNAQDTNETAKLISEQSALGDKKARLSYIPTTDSNKYESHFSLRIPISKVSYGGSTLHVIDADQDQIVLQELVTDEKDDQDESNNEATTPNTKVLVKRLQSGTYAQRALRMGYTLITVIFVGFLFVFCFQVLLFLFIALPVESGYTSQSTEVDGISIVSTLLSFPVMLYGMASLMAMGSAFVVDTWNGGALFRSMAVEIAYMCVFLVVPIFTLMVTLMAGSEDPWRITAGVWAILVCLTFCAFALAVTYHEVTSCFSLVERYFSSGISTEPQEVEQKKWKKLMSIANKALLLTQAARYSGVRDERYLVAGNDSVGNTERGGFSSNPDFEPVETRISLYSRITSLPFFSNKVAIFELLDPPKRVYAPEEVREILPVTTRNNWSMQKMWCGGGSRRQSIVAARGPSALSKSQMQFAFLCSVLSSVLLTLLFIGFLVWLSAGLGAYILVAVISFFCCIIPMINDSREMYAMYVDVNENSGGEDEEADQRINMFHIWETVRISRPKTWYCYARVLIEFSFFFLWPIISMLVKKNLPVALVFFFLASFTFLWRYFDASAVLSEFGSMSKAFDEDTTHLERYRLSEIVGRIINNKGRHWWSYTFALFFLAIFFLFLSALGTSEEIQPQERATRPPILLLDDFYYPPQSDTLAYPTCKLTKGFEFPGFDSADLADYAFLSAMAYESPNVTDFTLAEWFGPDNVVDEDVFVSQYRKDSQTSANPVYFKLFSFPSVPGYGVMSIRGSETAYDWIVNMQLWSAAGLGQVVKWLTPFGWIWEPILPDFIFWVNQVESNSISKVAYYKVTTRFVNDVLAGYGGSKFSNLQVTGASLGGGLAIITGAQTEAHTVAISGIGATLPRKTFDPPIALEKLNSQTFNFIPERDYIAMIGGRAALFQNGQCIAEKNNLFGCHSMWRSVCEINYKCGSNGRPVICRCVNQFGYPTPVSNGTRTFEEACEQAQDAWCQKFPC